MNGPLNAPRRPARRVLAAARGLAFWRRGVEREARRAGGLRRLTGWMRAFAGGPPSVAEDAPLGLLPGLLDEHANDERERTDEPSRGRRSPASEPREPVQSSRRALTARGDRARRGVRPPSHAARQRSGPAALPAADPAPDRRGDRTARAVAPVRRPLPPGLPSAAAEAAPPAAPAFASALAERAARKLHAGAPSSAAFPRPGEPPASVRAGEPRAGDSPAAMRAGEPPAAPAPDGAAQDPRSAPPDAGRPAERRGGRRRRDRAAEPGVVAQRAAGDVAGAPQDAGDSVLLAAPDAGARAAPPLAAVASMSAALGAQWGGVLAGRAAPADLLSRLTAPAATAAGGAAGKPASGAATRVRAGEAGTREPQPQPPRPPSGPAGSPSPAPDDAGRAAVDDAGLPAGAARAALAMALSPPLAGRTPGEPLAPLRPLSAQAPAQHLGAPAEAATRLRLAGAEAVPSGDELTALAANVKRILDEEARRHGIDV